MQYKFDSGHAIPVHEAGQHVALDFCQCRPQPVKTFNGTFVWKHSCIDQSDLIEQAEAIRQIISIELLREGQPYDPKCFIAFDDGQHSITWPPAAQKAQDFTDLEQDESYG